MSRYTLKTFCDNKLLEKFEHRAPMKLRSILEHPRMHRAGETSAWGEPLGNPNRFEILDSMQEKVFSGNIDEVETFVKSLR